MMLLQSLLATIVLGATPAPAQFEVTPPWKVTVAVAGGPTTTVEVTPATVVTVAAEEYKTLAMFDPKTSGWRKGTKLQGVVAQECTSRGMLDPDSVVVKAGREANAQRFDPGKDYDFDREWGTIGRLANGRIAATQPVYISYRHGLLRIDSIVLTDDGKIIVRTGVPHPAAPRPPELASGERRLANLWLPGRIEKLVPELVFPILETAYPEPAPASPSVAERLLPKTLAKLRGGQTLRVLAWGDSVTVGSFVPNPDTERWQAQFVARLRERFPQAKIELITEAWGGRNTGTYLAQPPGSEHNYREKVLAAKPDLIVSEFVNDAGLSPAATAERYGKLLADFHGIGAEWIILTPHYVRADWMGLKSEREIDQDPRPYVTGLRQFSEKQSVALADASLRWGRLWRQGIPYSSLLLNAINHPDARGMKLFADALMQLFPAQ